VCPVQVECNTGDDSGTDDQTLDVHELDGTTLKLSLEDDGEATKEIDLSSLQDGTGTDDQQLDVHELDGTTLKLSLEGDGEATKEIELSGLNTNLSQAAVEDYAGGLVTGNTETRITATYQEADNTLDLVVDDMNDDVPEAGDYSNLTGGDGIDHSVTGTVKVDLQASKTDALSATTDSASFLEIVSGKLTMLQGCSDNQIPKWDETEDDWNCEADATGSGGSAITYDLGDDDTDEESTDVNEIATTGDTNSIFTEPSADKILIAVGNNWPTADTATTATTATTANAGDSATAFFSSGAIEEARIHDDIARDSELPTASSLSVDDLISLSGVAEGAVNLGSFTGATIADNQTNKQALQALETAVEGVAGGHDAVTLNANATAGGLSLDSQEINFQAATNAQTGYATAAHITAIEANTDKDTNATHTGDVTGDGALTIGAEKIDEGMMAAGSVDLASNTITGTLPEGSVHADIARDSEITYESLSTNGDIGTGSAQVAQGDHNHSGTYEPANADIAKTDESETITGVWSRGDNVDSVYGASDDVTLVFASDISGVDDDMSTALSGEGLSFTSNYTTGPLQVVFNNADATYGVSVFASDFRASVSIAPDVEDSATLGTASLEWSDLYLANGAVIYGQFDGSNTITSSASGWTFALDAIISGNIELGHASDTTIARSGAGDITIEGNAVYRAGSTIAEADIHADIARDSELPTASSLSVDDLISLSGVAEGAANLGSFTGTTIADNQTNKQALQALETAVEGAAGGHDAVSLNANATAGGLSLSTQEINFRAATNAQTGYATAAHITAIEANTDKETNYTHTGDVTGDEALTIASNAVENSMMADSAIDTAELAADAVEGTKVADNAIDTEHLADDAITTDEIADSITLTTPNIGVATGTSLEANIILDDSPADNTAKGAIINDTVNDTVVQCNVIYLKSDGEWDLASNASEPEASAMLGMAAANGGSEAIDILLQGVCKNVTDIDLTTVGDTLYLGQDGFPTGTVPSTGNFARVIGYVLESDTIYFNPDNVWIEVP